MLVLSRKIEDKILIDGQIEIQILQIKGNTVRIGVKAPDDVKIMRGELKPFGMSEDRLELDIDLDQFLDQNIARAS
jgi:carbon storage regulator